MVFYKEKENRFFVLFIYTSTIKSSVFSLVEEYVILIILRKNLFFVNETGRRKKRNDVFLQGKGNEGRNLHASKNPRLR